MSADGRLWGGRFAVPPAPEMAALSRSEPAYFDLLPYDVAGSRAHVAGLSRVGVVTAEEAARVDAALAAIAGEYRAGALTPAPGDEDVHGFVERVLAERLGPLAGKIRAGRSRNDQAANNLRLYLRDRARTVHSGLLDVVDALLEQARRHARTLAPGFTHLQPAQPVAFGHLLLAHAQRAWRDADRIRDWDARTARSPLGAAALAGSPIVPHPEEAARRLGYDGVCANSVDAVSARDHVAEFLFAASMAGLHLSGLAEEVCLWVSDQFRWARLHDAYATGSSIMPQKKNPDIAELTRGKAGRLLGNLTGLLGVLKGLPLAYNRDLAEDKRAAMDSVETLLLTLPAMAGMIRTLEFDAERMRRDAAARFALATEVADWLALRGVPFSEAHEITGRLVRLCEERGCDLPDLDAAALRSVDARLGAQVRDVLSIEAAVSRRTAAGATAPERVAEQLDALAADVAAARDWATGYPGPRA
ncbi:argininosuccinate lyase [Phytohabitans sp. ZYX-F-186]|uniref:Argininosuccinate lyase n=1 Tax=Phytohabitans maris TaxID=3071409 RepID=A0ABU0ZDT3_9ACTN|nr:argininosuccinate lyase [Phytohabitans sp. ZYX-F-186]MDQ7905202.1 argininosuccinate lyase [Phytohabitans sp. ZYX-F-186]